MVTMQCFHFQNGGYLVATDCYVTPMLSVDKQLFLNMSGIIIFCLLSNVGSLCKKTYYSGVGFLFQSDQIDLNIFILKKFYVKHCRMKTHKFWTIYVDYRMFFNLQRGWPSPHMGSSGGGGGGEGCGGRGLQSMSHPECMNFITPLFVFHKKRLPMSRAPVRILPVALDIKNVFRLKMHFYDH